MATAVTFPVLFTTSQIIPLGSSVSNTLLLTSLAVSNCDSPAKDQESKLCPNDAGEAAALKGERDL